MLSGEPHVVVVHRWRDRYALYADYLDHSSHTISYVTTELGSHSVPAEAASVEIVPATDDGPAVRAALAELIRRHGRPVRLVALNEGDLDLAAQLRLEWDLPGMRPEELAPFRDKLTMALRASAAGLDVPAFADAPDAEAVQEFAAVHGWPLIVKPRRGTASRGVARVEHAGHLHAVPQLGTEPYLVQVLIDEPILHIDGLWTGTGLGPWRASRYVNTCAGFAEGALLGSVEIDDPELLAVIGDFTAEVGRAFGAQPWVFHLEAFQGTDEEGATRLQFLECGARVGGAEIPFVWREVHGVDLMTAAFDIQLGEQPALPPITAAEVGGWLLVPTPTPAPCTVRHVGWRGSGNQRASRPYAEVVPAIGAEVPKIGGYEHIGARFRFRASSTGECLAAIMSTMNNFELECEKTLDPLSPTEEYS